MRRPDKHGGSERGHAPGKAQSIDIFLHETFALVVEASACACLRQEPKTCPPRACICVCAYCCQDDHMLDTSLECTFGARRWKLQVHLSKNVCRNFRRRADSHRDKKDIDLLKIRRACSFQLLRFHFNHML